MAAFRASDVIDSAASHGIQGAQQLGVQQEDEGLQRETHFI